MQEGAHIVKVCLKSCDDIAPQRRPFEFAPTAQKGVCTVHDMCLHRRALPTEGRGRLMACLERRFQDQGRPMLLLVRDGQFPAREGPVNTRKSDNGAPQRQTHAADRADLAGSVTERRMPMAGSDAVSGLALLVPCRAWRTLKVSLLRGCVAYTLWLL